MTTETKNLVVLDEAKATYLKMLSQASADYRNSWEALAKRGLEEIHKLNNGLWVSGPHHQVMSEVEQEYGKIKMALNLVWTVFDLSIFDEDEQEAARKEVDQFLKIAMGQPKDFHGTWFHKGHTISDF